MAESENAADFPGPDFGNTIDPNAPSIDKDQRAQGKGSGKMIGGAPVKQGDYPDTVGVAGIDGDVRCTGVLIEPDLVLTAAHCANQGISARVFVGRERGKWVGSYAVRGSRHGLSPSQLPAGCRSLQCARDLAVLLLDRPVANVAPRAIAPAGVIDRASLYWAVGFGNTQSNGQGRSNIKQWAKIPSVSNSCGTYRGKADRDVYGCEPGQEIVAGQMRGSADTCNGDSGGPLYTSADGKTPPASTASYMLAGITSRPTSQSQRLCGDGGIYERLTADAQNWIAKTETALRNGQ